MAFRYRGVVEGFYGRPWSHAERLDTIRWMGRAGFNAYLYAPKDDALHRARWREAYPPDQMRRFEELVRAGEQAGVEFMLAISPGLSLVYSDPAELDRLWEKLSAFVALGVRSFGIFFDDIPPQLRHEPDRRLYTSLAQAQADFTRRLWERMRGRGLHLITCPTHYCGDPEVPYLQELGARLDPEIDVFWTGPAVCSRVITTDHMRRVGDVLGRRPLIWDNYPVNDGHMAPELHIGPYTGRDPELDRVTRGIFANPMNQPVASRLPLSCVAAYLRDPVAATHDPRRAWNEAARELLAPGGLEPPAEDLVEAFTTFAACQSISCLSPGEPETLLSLFRRFEDLMWSFRFDEGLRELQKGIGAMRQARHRLERAAQGLPFLAEIKPWIDDFGRWVDLLETGLDLILAESLLMAASSEEERTDRRERVVEAREKLRAGLKEAVDWPTRTCGDAARAFLQHLLRRSALYA